MRFNCGNRKSKKNDISITAMGSFLLMFLAVNIFIDLKDWFIYLGATLLAGIISITFFNHEQRKVMGYLRYQVRNNILSPHFKDEDFRKEIKFKNGQS